MIQNINISETYLYDHEFRKNNAEAYCLTQKNIEKISKIAIKKIQYPEFKEAYDYVDSIFPSVGIKNVIVHKVTSKDLKNMGYGGVEGFYDPVTKIVVISGAHKSLYHGDNRYKVEAKVEKDEVIVHEFCHYCYVFQGHRSISSEMREEFAYGWSVGYLTDKGYNDEYIIKYNFLPYLINVCSNKAKEKVFAQNGISLNQYSSFSSYQKRQCCKIHRKKIFEMAKEMSYELGRNIIKLYREKIDKEKSYGKIDDGCKRFNILDFS